MDPLLGEGVRILYADDDADLLASAAGVLEGDNEGFAVETTTTPTWAVDRLDESPSVDCVVSDYQMPEMDGLELLAAVRERRPSVPYILFTGKGSEEIASEAISAGVTDYIQKEAGVEQYAVLAKRIENAVAQRRAQRALERTKHRHQTLIRESSDVIAVVEADWTVRYVSPAAEHVLQCDPATAEGDSVLEFVHRDDRERVEAALDEVLEDPTAQPTVEFRFRRGDETWTRLEAEGRNLLDDEVIEGIAIYARDVTERVEREADLERYEQIVETGGDAAQVLSADGRYVMVNDALVDRTGYDRDELLGNTPQTVLDEDHYERAVAGVLDVLDAEDREFAEFELTIETKAGDRYPVEARVAPIVEDGEFRGSVGISREITDQKRRERELERQNERLSEFAGVVSHDLRNPLNVAQARAELALDEPASEHVEAIVDALGRMERLIEDLLTLAREGRTVEDPEPFDVEQVAREAWTAVETDGATLSVPDAGTVTGDRARVRQALENLFRNAVEHGMTGSPSPPSQAREDAGRASSSEPSVSDAPEDAEENDGSDLTVTVGPLPPGGFYVADDGVGLDGADPAEIFEPNYSTKADGTGLGLAIVRDIVEAHGWEIRATNSAADGARFEIVEASTDEVADD